MGKKNTHQLMGEMAVSFFPGIGFASNKLQCCGQPKEEDTGDIMSHGSLIVHSAPALRHCTQLSRELLKGSLSSKNL